MVACPEELRDYQLKVPSTDVFGEVFNIWEDFEAGAAGVASLLEFQKTLYEICDATPASMDLEVFLASDHYTRLRAAAIRALSQL